MTFEDCLRFVLKWEGGFSDDPSDHGGATNRGITQKEYDAWRKDSGLSARSVKEISDDEVAAIYRNSYWTAVGCSYLASPLNLVAFDSAVNTGVRQASKWLQRSVKVTPDGVVGKVTLSAIQQFDPVQVAEAVLDQRQDFYNDIVERDPTQGKWLNGWLNRVTALRKEIRNGA